MRNFSFFFPILVYVKIRHIEFVPDITLDFKYFNGYRLLFSLKISLRSPPKKLTNLPLPNIFQ